MENKIKVIKTIIINKNIKIIITMISLINSNNLILKKIIPKIFSNNLKNFIILIILMILL